MGLKPWATIVIIVQFERNYFVQLAIGTFITSSVHKCVETPTKRDCNKTYNLIVDNEITCANFTSEWHQLKLLVYYVKDGSSVHKK